MKREYINNFTGEVYTSLIHAIRTVFSDMKHYPKCRTWKMWNIRRLQEGRI